MDFEPIHAKWSKFLFLNSRCKAKKDGVGVFFFEEQLKFEEAVNLTTFTLKDIYPCPTLLSSLKDIKICY